MQTEAVEVHYGLIHWAIFSTGVSTTAFLASVAIVAFLITIGLLNRGKGSTVGVSVFMAATMPIFVGALIALQGGILAWLDMASAPGGPGPAEFFNAVSSALAPLWLGFWLAVPGYALTFFGTMHRSLSKQPDPQAP